MVYFKRMAYRLVPVLRFRSGSSPYLACKPSRCSFAQTPQSSIVLGEKRARFLRTMVCPATCPVPLWGAAEACDERQSKIAADRGKEGGSILVDRREIDKISEIQRLWVFVEEKGVVIQQNDKKVWKCESTRLDLRADDGAMKRKRELRGFDLGITTYI